MSGSGNPMRSTRLDRFEPPLFDDEKENFLAAIVVSVVLVILACIFVFCAPAKGDQLPWAKSAAWSSDLYVYSPPGSPGPTNFGLSNCQTSVQIPPGGAVVVRDFGAAQCSSAAFGTVGAVPGLVEFVKLTFRSGALFTTVNVPPMAALPAAGVRVGPISNIAAQNFEGTWVNFLSSGSGYVTVNTYDGAGVQVGSEAVLLTAPATQYRLLTQVQAGSIQVIPSLTGFLCFQCPSFSGGPLYGFVTVGSPSGSNLNTIPLN